MISSTSSTDRTLRTELLTGIGQSSQRTDAPRPDLISTENAAFLRTELQRQPEIRPEVVARAMELAEDPSYPPMEVLREVASQILRSPDLTEDES